MIRTTVVLFALVMVTFSQGGANDFHLFDSALAQVGMTHEDVRIDQDEMATWGGDMWRTRYFTMLHKNPFKLPKYGKLNSDWYAANVTNITGLLSDAGKKIDHPIRRGLIGDQLMEYTEIPDSLPHPSLTRHKNVLNGGDFDPLRKRIDLLYAVVDDEDHLFRRSMKGIDANKYRDRLFEYFVSEDAQHDDLVEELAVVMDFDRMIAGAQDFAEIAQRIADSLEYYTFPQSKIEIETRKGLIVVGTSGDEVYEYHEPPLLIIDGGGDDQYKFSGTPESFPLSVIVDVSGNDSYVSTDTTKPGIGGALLGISIVIDKTGDDYYQGEGIAQGAGFFGVGILLDHTGNDIYSGKIMCQGCGVFGIGILADSTGNDSLYAVIQSQGFGYTRGCGLLVNYEGNDIYVAENDTVINPSSQSADNNSSLCQGVGFGKRADFVDGHSWAGGIGILADSHGDDRYSAGLFAQGCAYWYSVGMLLDGDGNDTYNGIWYVQGSAAHFGVGYLDDFGGNDSYNPLTDPLNMAVGAGHDFSIGYLNERAGNDTYKVPNLSLGGGNVNGIGIFHDHSGDDSYTTKQGTTFGRAKGYALGVRSTLNTIGVFVDGEGEDKYDAGYSGNGSSWVSPRSDEDNPLSTEIGVGIDK